MRTKKPRRRASIRPKPDGIRRLKADFRRTTRALRVAKRCNEILVRAKTERALLREICIALVEEGGYRLAWVGFVENDPNRTVRPVASAGLEKGYLKKVRITWADTERGRGPVGSAVRTRRPVVCRFVLTDPNFSPWRKEALKRGYQSVIALPLKLERKIFGTLGIYAAEPDAFDVREQDLLWEMAEDLAYGIMAIRARAERRTAEGALRHEQQLLSSLLGTMPDHIYFKDRQSRFVRVNDAMARRFGVDHPAEVVGRTDFDFFSEEHARQAYEDEQRIMNTGQAIVGVEEKETWPDGHVTWVSTTKVPLLDRSGLVTGMVGISRDITERKEAETRLRLFRALIERSNDGIEVIDPRTGKYIDANERAFQSLGYAREEMLALSVFEVEQKLDRALIDGPDSPLRRTGFTTLEGVHQRKDGTTFPVEVSLSLVVLDREYVVAVVRDITERKRTENVLLLQSAALEAAANAIIITDRAGKIQSANRAFADLTGYQTAEVIGKNPRDLIKSDQHDREFYRRLWNTVLAGKVWDGEIVNRRKDGSLFTEEMTITPVRTEEGEITHFIAIKQDITERKKTVEHMQQQAALLDQANDAIYVRRIDGVVSYWSSGAERLYGWSKNEATGHRLGELNLTDLDATADDMTALLNKGGWIGERQQMTKAGRKVSVLVRLTVMKDERDRPVSIFAISTDITEIKQIEARFLQAQRLESIGALASGIAHDLNNVLAPIIIGAPLLREALTDKAARSMLDLMANNAQRGADIVKQVLTFARGSAGHRVPLQLRHLVRDLAKMAEETFPKNIRIETDAPPDLWLVEADATQMHQALLNLCINARDAMPDGGTLNLTAANVTLDEAEAAQTPGAHAGPYVRLRVADTGRGIPAELKNRVFEPFFTTKGPGKGTGLGLSTAVGIVRSHGGVMRLESEVGQGTTFELTLPATPGARAPAARESTPPMVQAAGDLVLLVDDELAVREAVRQVLDQFGYRVAICSTGAEAIEVFRATSGQVRLVITDIMMPEMDGPGLVRALRALNAAIPIVGITGVTDTETMGRLQELKLSALIAKPFTINHLLNTIHEVLGQSSTTTGGEGA